MRLAAALALLLASHLARAEEPTASEAQPPGPAAASPGPPSPGDAEKPASPAAPQAPAAAPAAAPKDESAGARAAAPPAAEPSRARGPARWGVLLDAGLPEGLTLSAVYRPVPSLRVFAGPAWNYVGFGLQGGVSVAPWQLSVTPVLTLEGGRYFGTDVSFVAKGGQGVPTELKPLLQDMSYTYGAAHLGLELGSPNGLSFSLDLGLAYILLEAKGTVTKNDPAGTVTFSDPRIRATLPSLRLGIHFWF